MTPIWNRRRRRGVMALTAIAHLGVISACGDGGARRHDAHQFAARRLDGNWEITVRLERRMSLSMTPATLPFSVRGTITMMTNDRIDATFASISEPTALGLYALRLDSLGLPQWQDGEVPALAARAHDPARGGAERDSVLIVLNPATPARIVRLTGVLTGESVLGEWTAASPLGGGGTFEMRRRVGALDARR
jgi:hypothetical protein